MILMQMSLEKWTKMQQKRIDLSQDSLPCQPGLSRERTRTDEDEDDGCWVVHDLDAL
jgi:hypothetical protein